MIEEQHIQCEIEELKIEMQRHMDALKNCTKLVKKNNEKLRKLKQMKEEVNKLQNNNWKIQMKNARYPMLEVIDENTVRIEGVKYQKVGTPRPKTLYDALKEKHGDVPMGRIDVCNIVRAYLIDHTIIETEDEDTVTFTIHKEQLQTPK
jgi:hypothetical protein